MNRKVNLLTALLGTLILLIGAFGNSAEAQSKPAVIKLWAAWPPINTEADQRMIEDMIDKKGKDVNLSVKYVGGPEVFETFQACEILQRGGAFDMAYTAAPYNMGVIPEEDVMKLMQTFPWEERKNGAFDLLNKWHRERGFEYLARPQAAVKFQAYLNKERNKPDLTGISMRLVPIYTGIVKALGGTGTSMAGGEIYTALQRGTIDGVFWGGGYAITPWGWQEILKYIWGPQFWSSDVVVLMNKKKFDSLSSEQRAILAEIMAEYERRSYGIQTKEQAKYKEELLNVGMKEIKFSKEDQARYLKIVYDEGWKGAIARAARVSELKALISK